MRSCKRNSGFSLVELITAISVLFILFSLLFPVVHLAKKSVLKSASLVHLNQIKAALGEYRQVYGYYPFCENMVDLEFRINDDGNRKKLIGLLSGQDRILNPKGIPFLLLSEHFFEYPDRPDSNLVDSFGNNDISILMDGNYDGKIVVGDLSVNSRLEVIVRENPKLSFPEIKTW